jgi:hypothetical protein
MNLMDIGNVIIMIVYYGIKEIMLMVKEMDTGNGMTINVIYRINNFTYE